METCKRNQTHKTGARNWGFGGMNARQKRKSHKASEVGGWATLEQEERTGERSRGDKRHQEGQVKRGGGDSGGRKERLRILKEYRARVEAGRLGA